MDPTEGPAVFLLTSVFKTVSADSWESLEGTGTESLVCVLFSVCAGWQGSPPGWLKAAQAETRVPLLSH